MSKNTEKITKALKAKGYAPVMIEWSPIGGSPIMCGPEGGWYIEYEEMDEMVREQSNVCVSDYTIMQYNIQDVLEEISALPECHKSESEVKK